MRQITGLCDEHSFETAVDLCRLCGGEFCTECLVRPSGKALCKRCAIAAGGVRNVGVHKPMARRMLKRRLKEFSVIRALKREPEEPAPVLTDPLSDHDPIGPPPGDDMHRLGVVLDDDEDDEIDADLVAQAAAQLSGVSSPPTSSDGGTRSSSDAPAPGGDVAPPIDWSNPFA